MKIFNFLVLILFSTIIFSISITAQTEKKSDIATDKIASVNPKAFEDKKTGIKDLINANKQLELKVEPQLNELKIEFAKLQELLKHFNSVEYPSEPKKDLQSLKREIEAKFEEYQKLMSEFKIKQASYKLFAEMRESEIIAPIKNRIGNALKQFGNEKGYGLILDSSKNSSMFTKSDIVDVTEEFIKFYNGLSEREKAR